MALCSTDSLWSCRSWLKINLQSLQNKVGFLSPCSSKIEPENIKLWYFHSFFGSFNSTIFKIKVLSLLEACFDLISGSSLNIKIQIMGGKITENLFCPFSFHFQILHKNCISLFLTMVIHSKKYERFGFIISFYLQFTLTQKLLERRIYIFYVIIVHTVA